MSNMATESKESIETFFQKAGFTNIQSNGFDTKEAASYTLATLNNSSYDVVTLTLKSLHYGHEWSKNFELGNNGDHQGFTDGANYVFSGLKDYLSTFDLSCTFIFLSAITLFKYFIIANKFA